MSIYAVPKPTSWRGTRRRKRLDSDGGLLRQAYLTVLLRDGGRCVRCGGTGPVELHHLRPRSRGGLNRPEDCALAHPECHRYIHDHPAESYGRGWLREGYAEISQ